MKVALFERLKMFGPTILIHELQNYSVSFVLTSFLGGKDTDLHYVEWSIIL